MKILDNKVKKMEKLEISVLALFPLSHMDDDGEWRRVHLVRGGYGK